MYEIKIVETGRNALKDEPYIFNRFVESVESVEEIKGFLLERYGKIPSGKNKVYRDKKDGSAVEVGFTYSYWSSDISHNSRLWYQTDWVSIYAVEKTVMPYSQIKEAIK